MDLRKLTVLVHCKAKQKGKQFTFMYFFKLKFIDGKYFTTVVKLNTLVQIF